MHHVLTVCLIALQIAVASLLGAAEPSRSKSVLLPPVQKYIALIRSELDQVPEDRRRILDTFAEQIAISIHSDGEAKLNFICTHNSRRSHLSQVWAQAAALHYGVDRIETFSGGTEATACNPRTIEAFRRAGFSIEKRSSGTNPHYEIRYSENAQPIEAFSKVYADTAAGNPDKSFIAVMCCSQADKECPVVFGATAKIPLHYEDPKIADNTPAEAGKYDERCRQIAVEMFYVMNRVAEKARS